MRQWSPIPGGGAGRGARRVDVHGRACDAHSKDTLGSATGGTDGGAWRGARTALLSFPRIALAPADVIVGDWRRMAPSNVHVLCDELQSGAEEGEGFRRITHSTIWEYDLWSHLYLSGSRDVQAGAKVPPGSRRRPKKCGGEPRAFTPITP